MSYEKHPRQDVFDLTGASCAGRNFTDRQRIRRRAANWGKNYRALAVLAAMMAVEAEDAAGSG